MARNKSKHTFELDVDKKKLEKGLGDVERQVNKTGESFLSGFKTKALLGIGAATAALGAFFNRASEWITAASDLQETTSKFETVFKDVRLASEAANKALQEEFGLSELQARKLLSATGDLLTGFGFTGEAALKLSDQVNRLAVDLASFSNAQGGAEAVSAALTKALLGERESLKTYGIAIRDADIQARIAEKGLKDLTGEARRQAEAMITLELAVTQSKNAIGDYARTSDSFANTARRFDAAIENLNASLGELLLPTITNVAEATTRLIDLFRQYVSVPTSEKIRDEQTELNSLVGAIISTNEKQASRNRLLDDLQKLYPDFLGNLDKEKVTNGELADQLQKVNDKYEERIRLQLFEERLTGLLREKINLQEKEDNLRESVNRKVDDTIDSLNLQIDKNAELEQKIFQVRQALTEIIQTTGGQTERGQAAIRLNNQLSAQSTSLLDTQKEIFQVENDIADIKETNRDLTQQTADAQNDAADASERDSDAHKNKKQTLEDELAILQENLKVEERERELTQTLVDNTKKRKEELENFSQTLRDMFSIITKNQVDVESLRLDELFQIDSFADFEEAIKNFEEQWATSVLNIIRESENFKALTDFIPEFENDLLTVDDLFNLEPSEILKKTQSMNQYFDGLIKDIQEKMNNIKLFSEGEIISDTQKQNIQEALLRFEKDLQAAQKGKSLMTTLIGDSEEIQEQLEIFRNQARQQAEFLFQSLGSSIGGGLAGAIAGEEGAMKDALKGILITLVNFLEQKLVLAEVDQLLDTLLSSISLNPAALLAAFAGLETVKAGIRNFATGTENFSGGMAKVHRDETLMLPPGTDIVNARQSQQLERAAANPNAETNALLKELINVTANKKLVIRGSELREVLRKDERNRL